MTRKSGSKLLAATAKNSSSNAGAGGAGYCEVCRVNYTWLEEHLSSVGHIKAVTDPTQYQELDSLITASGGWLGTGPRKSLRIAKSPPPNQQSPPPPTILHCNGHQTATPTSQQGLSNGVNPRRSSERKSPRGRVVRKRLSAEEKLIEDNRAYYKVEVLNSKLRSTGCLQRQLGSSREEDDEEDSSSEEEKETTGRMGGILGSSSLPNGQTNNTLNDSVVVRFKKVRKSELTVLSDEAENFMFGVDRKDEQSQQDESNEETTKKKRRTQAEVFINDNTDYYKFELAGSRLRYQGTTLAHVPTPPKEDRLGKYPGRDESTQSMLRSGKSPHNEDHTLSRLRSAAGKSPPKEDSFHPRLRSGGKSPPQEDTAHTRLRSAAGKSPPRNQVVKELVPHPHPRLRSIDTPPPLEPRLRSCPGLTPVKENPVQRLCPPSEDDPAPELTLSHTDITYAFELSNTDGVWAEVCERFDNYQEEVLPHYYSYPSVVLPSEMSYLERLKLLTRRRRRMSRGFDDKPRKSPRCHASTLAIMSSVLPKSRLCETQPVQLTPPPPPTPPVPTAEDEDTTTSSLTAESSVSDPNHDSRAILQRYMQHYLSLLDSAQPKAMTPRPWDPSEGCDDVLHTPEATPDFLTMMDNNDCPTMDVCTQETLFQLRSFDATTLDSCNSSDCSEIFGFSEDGRSFFGRRKKKKRHNLTGWPKEKPRRNKFLNFSKKSRVIKSEPIDPNDPETESSNIVENFVLSFADMRNELSQFKKKRGRPRIYPPGMSPSVLKVKLARESAALKRSSSVSPVKHRPSLKAHPL